MLVEVHVVRAGPPDLGVCLRREQLSEASDQVGLHAVPPDGVRDPIKVLPVGDEAVGTAPGRQLEEVLLVDPHVVVKVADPVGHRSGPVRLDDGAGLETLREESQVLVAAASLVLPLMIGALDVPHRYPGMVRREPVHEFGLVVVEEERDGVVRARVARPREGRPPGAEAVQALPGRLHSVTTAKVLGIFSSTVLGSSEFLSLSILRSAVRNRDSSRRCSSGLVACRSRRGGAPRGRDRPEDDQDGRRDQDEAARRLAAVPGMDGGWSIVAGDLVIVL